MKAILVQADQIVTFAGTFGYASLDQATRDLCDIATRRHLAIISDEVFNPFLFFPTTDQAWPAHRSAPLVFTFNGFSKMFALPGLKIGWIAVTGQTPLVQKALNALEMISDTFLPVQEAAQAAVPALFKQGRSFLKNYRAAVQSRAVTAIQTLEKIQGLSFTPPCYGYRP